MNSSVETVSITGELRCVVWAVRHGEAGADGKRPSLASCETFVITLRVDFSGARNEARLTVSGVLLLRRSNLAPHFVMANAEQDAVLLGLDPASCFDDEVGQATQDGVAHIDCRNSGAGTSHNASCSFIRCGHHLIDLCSQFRMITTMIWTLEHWQRQRHALQSTLQARSQ